VGESPVNWPRLGERLYMMRRRRDLTAHDLARQAGTTRNTISMLENGRKPRISLDVIVRIGNVLGVSVEYLLGREELNDSPQVVPNLAPVPS
jgi:transcriptional regulator with XRE-family HTH domain